MDVGHTNPDGPVTVFVALVELPIATSDDETRLDCITTNLSLEVSELGQFSLVIARGQTNPAGTVTLLEQGDEQPAGLPMVTSMKLRVGDGVTVVDTSTIWLMRLANTRAFA
jgi:hypothetical protein